MPGYGHTELAFVIANGAAGQSAAVQLNGLHVEGIIMPGMWATAPLSFLGGETSDGSFLPLVDAMGQEITLTVAASKRIMMPVGLIRGINWLKLQSGTSAVPVNQTANRSLVLLARAYG